MPQTRARIPPIGALAAPGVRIRLAPPASLVLFTYILEIASNARADGRFGVRMRTGEGFPASDFPDSRGIVSACKRNGFAFLVARVGTHRNMRWGYLVDFLVPENSNDVLSSLIGEALDDFGRNGVAAVTCYATDPGARRALLRHGFFPSPGRKPIHFNHFVEGSRTDLQKFSALDSWYLTMVDGEFEMNL